MRTIVFFDLPTLTAEDKRAYRAFRKLLIENGFFMMQESVYCRLLLNGTAQAAVVDIIRKKAPPKGLVQVLTVTENQFQKMEFIVGESSSETISSPERLIIL